MSNTRDELEIRKLRAQVQLLEKETGKCRYCEGRGTVLKGGGVNTSGGHNGHIAGRVPGPYRASCSMCAGSGKGRWEGRYKMSEQHAKWSYRYGGSPADIASKYYPTSLLRNGEYVLTGDCDNSGHWLRGINGDESLQAVLDTLNGCEQWRPDGWEKQDQEFTRQCLHEVAQHLGVIDDNEAGDRLILLSAPNLHLVDHENGPAEVSAGYVQEDCLRAIDELKTLVVLLNRFMVARDLDSGDANWAVQESTAYLERMRNCPIRSHHERAIND